MATIRKITLINGGIYHIFNRSIERKNIFNNVFDLKRAKSLIKYYKHTNIPIRFSKVIQQPIDIRQQILNNLYLSDKSVEIISYNFMPNHFHFQLKQNVDKGISTFLSNFANAYVKYFNTKYKRSGPLFENAFKAVYIENEEQLIHLSRYIHINPVVSSMIKKEELESYPWSSYPEYLGLSDDAIVSKDIILDFFKSVKEYKEFVTDQIDYAKKLEEIKHLLLE